MSFISGLNQFSKGFLKVVKRVTKIGKTVGELAESIALIIGPIEDLTDENINAVNEINTILNEMRVARGLDRLALNVPTTATEFEQYFLSIQSEVDAMNSWINENVTTPYTALLNSGAFDESNFVENSSTDVVSVNLDDLNALAENQPGGAAQVEKLSNALTAVQLNVNMPLDTPELLNATERSKGTYKMNILQKMFIESDFNQLKSLISALGIFKYIAYQAVTVSSQNIWEVGSSKASIAGLWIYIQAATETWTTLEVGCPIKEVVHSDAHKVKWDTGIIFSWNGEIPVINDINYYGEMYGTMMTSGTYSRSFTCVNTKNGSQGSFRAFEYTEGDLTYPDLQTDADLQTTSVFILRSCYQSSENNFIQCSNLDGVDSSTFTAFKGEAYDFFRRLRIDTGLFITNFEGFFESQANISKARIKVLFSYMLDEVQVNDYITIPLENDSTNSNMVTGSGFIEVPVNSDVYFFMRIETFPDTLIVAGTDDQDLGCGAFIRAEEVNTYGVPKFLKLVSSSLVTYRDINNKLKNISSSDRFVSYLGSSKVPLPGDDTNLELNNLWLQRVGPGVEKINNFIKFLGYWNSMNKNQSFDFDLKLQQITGDDNYTLSRFLPINDWMINRGKDGPWHDSTTGERFTDEVIRKLWSLLMNKLIYTLDNIENDSKFANTYFTYYSDVPQPQILNLPY